MFCVTEGPITARADPAVMNIYEKISRAKKLIKALCGSSLCCHRAHVVKLTNWSLSALDVGQTSGPVIRDPSVAAAELITGDGSGRG